MSVEKNRLLSLIEFSQQSARLRGKPAATVAAHGLFAQYEHEIQGLPGIRINVNGPESADEIWLVVERLHEMRPPDIASAVLRPWVQITQAPTDEPRLRELGGVPIQGLAGFGAVDLGSITCFPPCAAPWSRN